MNAAALAFLIALAHAQQQRTWNFDMDEPGKKPEGFYFDETGRAPDGKWRVVEHEGNKVLAQLDENRDRDRYALAVVDDFALEHLRISVRIKAVEGDVDQDGGVMWRYRNSENYLVARLDIREKNVRLYRFVRGNRVQFGVEEGLDVQVGQWYTLRVEHRGRQIKVYLNDEVLFIERDRHFTRPGKVGLWTKSDSVVYFDDLEVKELDDPDDDDDDD
jgi:hypothetical protein